MEAVRNNNKEKIDIDLSSANDSDENILDDVNEALKNTDPQNQNKMKKRNPFSDEVEDKKE